MNIGIQKSATDLMYVSIKKALQKKILKYEHANIDIGKAASSALLALTFEILTITKSSAENNIDEFCMLLKAAFEEGLRSEFHEEVH